MPSIHQVNHPGREQNISYKVRNNHTNDYKFYDDSTTQGIRYWNRMKVNGKNNSHKRKFMEVDGKYVEGLNSRKEKLGTLRFWGEYEGHSQFELIKIHKRTKYWNEPYAVHIPFFCDKNINDQNTDPFIFGDYFYYSVCKKKKLKNLQAGDIVIFGSEFGKKNRVQFYLDTVLVIDNHNPTIESNEIKDKIFLESTINRLGKEDCSNGFRTIHIGQKFEGNEIFSFFPAKPSNGTYFGRPILNTEKLKFQTPGARTGCFSRELKGNESIQSIWEQIVNSVIEQGFVLGTHANKLVVKKLLPESPI
jgi:hypothetical protein